MHLHLPESLVKSQCPTYAMVWLSEFVFLREYPSLLAMVWDCLNKFVADEVVLGRLCPISLGFRSTFSQH